MMNKAASEQVQHRPNPHRAFYHAVSKQRWSVFQKRVLHFWQQEDSFRTRNTYSRRYYIPLLKALLTDKPDDIKILEIGSGPICAAQYLEKGSQTYIDPLLDDFRRIFPGKMPEDAVYMPTMVEKVEMPKQSFDVVICLNTLSDVLNPELVLNKVEQTLKPDGTFVVSIDLWPSWLARAHFFLSRFAPGLPRLNRLYSYTHKGIFNTLSRHFNIVSEQRVGSKLSWLSLRKEYFFVCEPRKKHKGISAK